MADPAEGPQNSLASPLYLASASPRRRELLKLLGYSFTVVVSRFDEDTLNLIADPAEYVTCAARGKALEVAHRRKGIVIGVDTDVVGPAGDVLGKPRDADDAARLLRMLSGRTHQVYTGVCVVKSAGGAPFAETQRTVRTDVTFAKLSDETIAAYVASGEPMDKAGAYGIQGKALAFVEHINGDPSSVIGLPLTVLADILGKYKSSEETQDSMALKPVRIIVE